MRQPQSSNEESTVARLACGRQADTVQENLENGKIHMKFHFDAVLEKQVKKILSQMTLKEKVALLSGQDSWHTVAIPRLGVPSVVVTDGPHGVRTSKNDKGRTHGPATWFPTCISMGASWDPELVGACAAAMARETRAYGCDVLLGPCINIIRMPLNGRNFETVSEDPFLSGRIAVGYVRGLQQQGVGASVKHYACNNQEYERGRISVEVDERTLREIYLPHFEAVVKETQPATVMCSYNRVNGDHTSQHRFLLTQVLKEEWGFQGLVVSDWGANHTIVESMRNGLDLEMPGPAGYYGWLLESAVNHWQIEELEVEAAARRVLRVVLALARTRKGTWQANTKAHQALARKLADASIVLLKNEGQALPLDFPKLRSLALVGPTANMCPSGGGSSAVPSPYRVTPLAALKKVLPGGVKLVHETGVENYEDPPLPEEKSLRPDKPPQGAQPNGLAVQMFNGLGFKGTPVITQVVDQINYWHGPGGGLTEDYCLRYTTIFKARHEGWNYLQLIGGGSIRMWVDGKNVASEKPASLGKPDDQKRTCEATLWMKRGREYHIRIEYQHPRDIKIPYLRFGIGAGSNTDFAEEINRAVQAAARCDAAVVCIGFQEGFETEGHDRKNMAMTGRQDELVAAVAAVNPRTIVVVNAGAPVAMPWVGKVQAILFTGYAGQEMGAAIAAIILGRVNPSGKLPVSFPERIEDNPAYGNYPGTRTVHYGEGVLVGYRWYDTKKLAPRFCFGHGLSYTNFKYSALALPKVVRLDDGRLSGPVKVSLTIRNTGSRPGAEVVQLYVGDVESSVNRPTRELKGFQKILLKPGESRRVEFVLDHRSLAFFHPGKKQWTVEPGAFTIEAGASSRDIRLKKVFNVVQHLL